MLVIFMFELSSFVKNKKHLNHIKKVCENKNFCVVIMPSEDTKMFKFNQCHKSEKTPSIIYADIKSLIKRIDGYKDNFEKSSKA